MFGKVTVGHEYGVAFPLIRNASTQVVTVTRVRLVHIPPGVKVVGYRAVPDHSGVIVMSYEGTGQKDDYLTYRNLFASHFLQLKPHSFGNLYFAADFRVTSRDLGRISGCQVYYRVGTGELRQQTFGCTYGFMRERSLKR